MPDTYVPLTPMRSTLQALGRAPRAVSGRRPYIDVFRGLLIAHMAFDHASLMFNPGRGGEELAALEPAAPSSLMQFLARFTGVPVAPGFCVMAGFMVALTSSTRAERGLSSREITRRLIVRGLVLILADALVLGLPRLARGFYSFVILSSIGVSLILLAALRHQRNRVLVPAALAMLTLHPLLDVSGLPTALRAILYEPVREGAVRSLYPVIPWCAFVVLGFVLGRDALARERPARFWASLGALALFVFFVVRLARGYGNAYPHTGLTDLSFWSFAKYPPDLAFTSWSLALTFLTLAGVWLVTRRGTPRLLEPLAVFGRVPFFFYVLHFYVLGLAMPLVGTRLGLLGTAGVWLGLLLVMFWPCAWYSRKMLERPNLVTRYL